jgi:hypothetical protein
MTTQNASIIMKRCCFAVVVLPLIRRFSMLVTSDIPRLNTPFRSTVTAGDKETHVSSAEACGVNEKTLLRHRITFSSFTLLQSLYVCMFARMRVFASNCLNGTLHREGTDPSWQTMQRELSAPTHQACGMIAPTTANGLRTKFLERSIAH